MRAFIAIPIPEPVKNELARIQQSISGVKWQDPDQYHLTLKFLGDLSEKEVMQLQADLAQVSISCFSITINRLGFFPDSKHPSVLWAGVEKNELLLSLQQKIENTCLSMGLKARKHSFIPHITLARIDKAARQKVQEWAKQHEWFLIPEVSVHEFVLYESRLHTEGATHHRLKAFPLEGR